MNVEITNPKDRPGYVAIANTASNPATVQEIKDASRLAVNYYANNAAAGATGIETAITLTQSKGLTATSNAASFVIPAGKRFRITAITFASRGHATATAQITVFALRVNAAGAVTTTSTPVLLAIATATPATSSAWDRFQMDFPDGFEITGDGTLQFGVTANSVFVTNAPTWFVHIEGFEY